MKSDIIHDIQLESDATAAIYVETFDDWTDPAAYQEEGTHRHNFHEILYVHAGRGQHTIDGYPYAIVPPTLCLIAAGQVHVFGSANALSGVLIAFTADLFALEHKHYLDVFHAPGHEAIAVSALDDAYIGALLRLIVQTYGAGDGIATTTLMLRHLTQALLVKIEALSRTMPSDAAALAWQHTVRSFNQLLEAHYKQQHGVGFYADALGLSVSQLARVVQQALGKTPKQLIAERLGLEAKRYLQFTDWSVKRISASLGYSDPLYFSRWFKNTTQLSPLEFRSQRQKNP